MSSAKATSGRSVCQTVLHFLHACLGQVYPEGRMSQHLDHLKIGDNLEFKGPKGRFVYSANMKKAIGAILGCSPAGISASVSS